MATNMPEGNRQSLAWLEGMVDTWSANYAAIGLTSAQAFELAADVASTRDAFTSVEEIRLESQARTRSANTKSKDLQAIASTLILTIKGHARSSGNASAVYLASGISPANAPSPVPHPEAPVGVRAELGGDGAITIHFKGRGPVGTVWEVSRKLPGETAFSKVGIADVATKSFTDAALPGAISRVQYRVQGIRGSVIGPPSMAFIVQFGSGQAQSPASTTTKAA